MKVEMVAIGNSRGIRIPKPLIEACGFGDTVELRVEKKRLFIEAGSRPRRGWENAFQAAGPSGEDELLVDGQQNEFDRKDWRW